VGFVELRSRWSLVEAGNEIDKARLTLADVPRFYRYLSADGNGEVDDSEEPNTKVDSCLLPPRQGFSGGCLEIVDANTRSARPGNKIGDFLLGGKVDELGLAVTLHKFVARLPYSSCYRRLLVVVGT
jgi:hypothetical protein